MTPLLSDDNLATRASLLGRLKNWEDAESWGEFTQTKSRLIRLVALKAGLTESEAKDVEQETLLCVAQTIYEPGDYRRPLWTADIAETIFIEPTVK